MAAIRKRGSRYVLDYRDGNRKRRWRTFRSLREARAAKVQNGGKIPCCTAAKWGERWDSNPRPPEPQSGALPTELRPPLQYDN